MDNADDDADNVIVSQLKGFGGHQQKRAWKKRGSKTIQESNEETRQTTYNTSTA